MQWSKVFLFRNITKLPAKKYIKHFSGTTRIYLWKSNGMLEENIENITNSESNFAPPFVNHHLLPAINVNRDCLINNISVPKKSNKSIYFLHIKFMVKKFKQKISLNNCLFGSVKLTKNADLDKYKYSCYSIGFDSR